MLNGNNPQVIHKFNTSPIKSQISFVAEIEQLTPRFKEKLKESSINKSILFFKKRTNLEDCHFSIINYSKQPCGIKDKHTDQQNRTDSPEVRIYASTIKWMSTRLLRQFNGENSLSISDSGTMDGHMHVSMKLDCFHTTYTKISSKLITPVDMRHFRRKYMGKYIVLSYIKP